MSGPRDGNYVIRIPVPGQLIEASANNKDGSAVKPVTTLGQMRVWSLKDEGDGKYKLVLEDNWYSSNDDHQVVVKTSVDPGTRWKLEREGDLYAIKSSDDDTTWTATRDPVVLAPLVYGPDQLWEFLPVRGD